MTTTHTYTFPIYVSEHEDDPEPVLAGSVEVSMEILGSGPIPPKAIREINNVVRQEFQPLVGDELHITVGEGVKQDDYNSPDIRVRRAGSW